MKLTDLVASYGYSPSDRGEISKAKLYERKNPDGVTELLCVQKVGYLFRVDLMAMSETPFGVQPVGSPLHNHMVHKDELEEFMKGFLTRPSDLPKSRRGAGNFVNVDMSDLQDLIREMSKEHEGSN